MSTLQSSSHHRKQKRPSKSSRRTSSAKYSSLSEDTITTQDLANMSGHKLGVPAVDMEASQRDVFLIDSTDDDSDELNDLEEEDTDVAVNKPKRGMPERQKNRSYDSGKNRRASSARYQRTATASSGNRKKKMGRVKSLDDADDNNNDFWKPRAGATVDQSVNLMDVDSEIGDPVGAPAAAPRRGRARPGMSKGQQQKSMVDIFLSDDQFQTRGGKKPLSGMASSSTRASRNRKVCCLVVFVMMLVGILFLVIPQMGISNDSSEAPPPAKKEHETEQGHWQPNEVEGGVSLSSRDQAATLKEHGDNLQTLDFTAPIDNAANNNEEEEEEEEQEDSDNNNNNPPLTNDHNGDWDGTPPMSEAKNRLEALEYWVYRAGVHYTAADGAQGTPQKHAVHWLSQQDAARLPIPGFTEGVPEGDTKAEEVLIQRYALAVLYFTMKANENNDSSRRRRQQRRNLLRQLQSTENDAPTAEELSNRKTFDEEWLSAKHYCQWPGVTCGTDQQTILSLTLQHYLLQGTLPQELLLARAMPGLTDLDLSHNQLTGTLPTLDRSTTPSHLESLQLRNNLLQGDIPPEWVTEMPSLIVLDVSDNKLSGQVHNNVKFPHLQKLILSNNQFTGPIPGAVLKQMTNLKLVELVGNQISRGIPNGLHALTRLTGLLLSHNKITGSLPATLGSLSHLKTLDLDGNKLQGSIPTELSQLTKLERLQLDGNDLVGEMPDGVCNLVKGNPDDNLRHLESLVTDCASGEMVCECCTDCF